MFENNKSKAHTLKPAVEKLLEKNQYSSLDNKIEETLMIFKNTQTESI